MKDILQKIFTTLQTLQSKAMQLDFLAPLALRLYLIPVFWSAGMNKFNAFEDTVGWFGNPDWGLGLPAPWLMAFLATAAELGGAILLALGFAVRLIAIPLMVTMLVAAFAVHWDNGWQAIADPSAPFANERVESSAVKKDKAIEILKDNGNYSWLTSSGSFAIINNGIEFAITYLVMLIALFFMGGGRYVSVDDWLKRYLIQARIIA